MEKAKGSFGLMMTAIIILALAFGVFTSISSSIDGTNDYNNVTASSTNTVYGIVPLVLVIGAVVLSVAFINWYVSSTTNYRKVNKTIDKILTFLDTSTYYFGFGLFAYAIFGTVAFGIYLSYRMLTIPGAGDVSFEIGKWILIIITFFFATAGIGYLFEKKLWSRWRKRKEEQKHYETMQELPGETI